MGTLVEFKQVTKRFGGVTALKDVSFTIEEGEFLALCGENGAGKSTLMKILSGVISDYEGSIELRGQPLRLTSPRDAEHQGISIIHQELNLVNDLTAAANIFLGREPRTAWGLLDDAKMERDAQVLFEQLECGIRPRDLVRSLRIGDQQLVEIAKALSLNARLLIMDEPTSALTEAEVERLFRIIDRLREQRVTIVYISHKMNEVFRGADRITVLRDGQVVRTLSRAESTPKGITHLMVGREIEQSASASDRQPGEEVLRVDGLSVPWPEHPRGWRLKDVSLTSRRGEVIGIAGLMGAGRTELLECLYGASPEAFSGSIQFRGQPVRFEHPSEALHAGIAMVSEDRKRCGIFPEMTVRDHITLSSLVDALRLGVVHAGAENAMADESIQQLRIKTASREARIGSLSGGNQQKCLIARALRSQPTLLLLDDPTRGIDVGAKAEIYRLIHELSAAGLSIIITSSELPELIAVCDRILVLCEGQLTGEFPRAQFSEQALMEAATKLSAV